MPLHSPISFSIFVERQTVDKQFGGLEYPKGHQFQIDRLDEVSKIPEKFDRDVPAKPLTKN